MSVNELISIIVPVYNAENFIRETIDCVLAQTYPCWELLLMENGSTDRSVDVILEILAENEKGTCKENGKPQIRLVRLPSGTGAAMARNRGVMEAEGRYIAYLDADDLWVPEKLERELAFMKARNAAFVFTGYEFADKNGCGTGRIVHVPEKLEYRQALSNTTIFTTTVMFDTEKIARKQLMMPQVKSEDTALWWKVLKAGYTAYGLDENLAKYRRAGKSLSSNKLEALRRIWNLYRRVEGLGIPVSAWYFCLWAVRAVRRRI